MPSIAESSAYCIAGLITGAPFQRANKKVTKRKRRSFLRDKQAAETTREIHFGHKRVSKASLVGKPTPPKITKNENSENPKTENPTTPTTVTLIPANDDALSKPLSVPPWTRTTDYGKAIAANRVIAQRGGYPFTLNLGPEVMKAANDDKKGFTDHMKRRVSRALKRVLGEDRPYWFALDVAENDRLHLHGAIQATENDLQKITDAMIHAGGKWASTHHRDKQFQFHGALNLQDPDRHPDGWVAYALRNCGKVRRLAGDRIITISGGLRRLAREYHETIIKRDRHGSAL